MPAPAPEPRPRRAGMIVRLLVRNHPGVMSHVSGLFARRAFNLEGVLCVPVGDGTRSAMLLHVDADARNDQVLRQLAKLADVLEVRAEPDGRAAFEALATWLAAPFPSAVDGVLGRPA